MANWKGHVAGGLVTGAAYVGVVALLPVDRLAEAAGLIRDWQILVAVLVVCVLFAIFPDVDTNSKAQDLFFGIVFPLDIVLLATDNIQAAAYLGLVAMLPIIGHHRGWTHKKWAMFVVPLPILIIPYLYNSDIVPTSAVLYVAAVAGYFSHLLLDGLVFKRFRIKND